VRPKSSLFEKIPAEPNRDCLGIAAKNRFDFSILFGIAELTELVSARNFPPL
jgi:hypothetical protein